MAPFTFLYVNLRTKFEVPMASPSGKIRTVPELIMCHGIQNIMPAYVVGLLLLGILLMLCRNFVYKGPHSLFRMGKQELLGNKSLLTA